MAADCSPRAITFIMKRTNESICPTAFTCSGELFCEMYFNAKMTNNWPAPVIIAIVKILLSIRRVPDLLAKIKANSSFVEILIQLLKLHKRITLLIDDLFLGLSICKR